MSNAETITVPHLGTSTIGYKLGKAYDASLPTLVMVNSFTTSVELYRPQFADEQLAATANLLAIEPYGHGQTRATYEQFTYWDSRDRQPAGARSARHPRGVRPGYVAGRLDRGPHGHARPRHGEGHHSARHLDGLREPAQPRPGVLGRNRVLHAGHRRPRRARRRRLGDPDRARRRRPPGGLRRERAARRAHVLATTYQKNYTGDAGRQRVRISTINLRDRDGLHGRLDGVRCPVLWMHGTADPVYSVANAEDEIRSSSTAPMPSSASSRAAGTS